MDLTQRQRIILKTLVEQFTYVAEPIGSKALIPLLDFPVSSATIRNELAVLEKEGLLEKTHTSSGRIPSKKGYRYYVEHLMEIQLDEETAKTMKQIFHQRHCSIEDMIETSCSILSEMTHLTSVVVGPEQGEQKLVKIQLIPISDRQAVAIFVTSSGHTEHRIFNFSQNVSLKDLTECTELLNDQLTGLPISSILEEMKKIEPLMAARITRHEVLFEAFFSAFMKFSTTDGAVYGRANMLCQPEFANSEKLQELMRCLENASLFHAWTDSNDGVSVPIGTRNELTQIGECSVLSARFQTGEGEEGQLMVIGPNRMPYSRIVALMDCMSEQIEGLLGTHKQGGSKNEQEIQSEETKGSSGSEDGRNSG